MKFRNGRIVASAPIALALVFASANANASQETKVPHTPPGAQDIKTPAPVLPAKEALPARQAVPVQQLLDQSKGQKLPPALANAKFLRDLDRTFLSTQADGTVWAMGRDYKAQFNASTASYIPRFGAKAPKNFPVNFRTSSASVGGTPIALASDVAATQSGDTVQFERGGLTEVYEIRTGSIEQEFVFKSLPASGDLVVRLAVETELSGSASSEGFRFSNDFGYVGYGKAVAIDAAGHRFDATTSLEGNSIEIRVPAAAVGEAVLPLTIDPVITTITVDTAIAYDNSADVAFDANTGRFLVSWEDAFSGTDHDVWAQEYDNAGNLIAGSTNTIDYTTNYWSSPRCASNYLGANFLVVAEVGSSPRSIWGATYAAAGAAVSAQFAISSEPTYDCHAPDVGGDPVSSGPTYYLVVWQREFAAGDSDVHGQLVNSNATLNGGLILIDNSSSTLDFTPTVSKSDGLAPFSTQNWTVTWTREFTAGIDYDIWGSQLLWDGTITHATYMIDYTGAYDYSSMASTVIDGNAGERDYMVVYNRYDGVSDVNIHGQVYNGVTSQADADLSLLDTNTAEQQLYPCVDSDGANYAVGYTESYLGSTFDYDLYVSTFTRIGSQIKLTEGHQLLDFSGWQSNGLQIASQHGAGGNGTRSMLAWYDVDPTYAQGDIYAGIYDNAEFTSFCSPGVDTAACPCGNPPSGANRGCNNSSNTGGAQLTASGHASLSNDTVQFFSAGEKPTATSIFLQGNTPNLSGLVFGQGIRCVAGSLKRLYVRTASGGAATAPTGLDPRVSVRSAALGDTINPGENRYYLVYYRDPVVLGGCPAASTFNATQTGAFSWIP